MTSATSSILREVTRLPKPNQVKRGTEQRGGGRRTLASTRSVQDLLAVPCRRREPHGAISLFQGELLSPCRCDGSVKCTHQPCLIKWISERGCWSCELCYYKYHVIAISTKNPLQVKVLETFQSLFILGPLFVSGSK